MQPLARLHGRLKHGLTPWRNRGGAGFTAPVVQTRRIWCEQGSPAADRIETIARDLKAHGVPVRVGGDFDPWDLELGGGPFAAARVQVAVEEHTGGRQLVRFRAWPNVSVPAAALAVLFAALAVAAVQGGVIAAVLLGAVALGLTAWMTLGAGAALAAGLTALGRAESRWK
jgi:hypothetical protein